MCNRILSFTSGATPADLLTASMAADLFSFTYLQTSIGGARDRAQTFNKLNELHSSLFTCIPGRGEVVVVVCCISFEARDPVCEKEILTYFYVKLCDVKVTHDLRGCKLLLNAVARFARS